MKVGFFPAWRHFPSSRAALIRNRDFARLRAERRELRALNRALSAAMTNRIKIQRVRWPHLIA